LRPLDEATLQLFSDRLLHAVPYTSDPRALAIGLDSVQSGGGTALNDRLFAALLGLEARQGRRLVVVLSDGVDVDSVLDVAQVEELAARSQALVYWIRLLDEGSGPGVTYLSAWRNGAEHRREIDGLRSLVESSGGRVLDLARIEEAESAFREILAELREQYVIGYYPTNARGDGAWHSLRVGVERPGLTARSRAGYRDE
jgi:Ca-activated chloride channel family protein